MPLLINTELPRLFSIITMRLVESRLRQLILIYRESSSAGNDATRFYKSLFVWRLHAEH